jgi:hypothetical protein
VVSGVTLTVNGATVSGASAITYRPGDQVMSGWTSSNGLTNTLSYDSDGRLAGIAVSGIESLGFDYDKANRITSLINGIDTDQSEAPVLHAERFGATGSGTTTRALGGITRAIWWGLGVVSTPMPMQEEVC